jgi:hypothetical protein
MKKQLSLSCLLFVLLLQSCNAKKETDPQPASTTSSSNNLRVSGLSWTKSTVTGNWLASSFVDQYTGYITGLAGSMVKTTDGGVTYTPIVGLPPQHFYGCYFQTPTTGFIAGDNNTALRTSDAGITWTPLSLPALPAVHFRNIYFYNSSIGFITGGAGTILKTTDGGATWSLANRGINPTYAIYSMIFFDANTGLAGSNYGGVYRTTDGGATWTLTTVHDPRSIISSMALISVYGTDSLYITTSIGNSSPSDQTTFLISGDRGRGWVKKTIPGSYQALSSAKITPGVIYMAGGDVANNIGVLYSNTTGGNIIGNWTQEPIPASGRLMTLSLIPYSTGNAVVFASGLNNTILKGQ